MPMRSIIVLILLAVASLSQPEAAFSQTFSLGDLFGTEKTQAPTLPQSSITEPGEAPSALDYGKLTSKPDPMLGMATDAVSVFRARLVDTIGRIPEVWPAFIDILRDASATGRPSYFMGVALFAAMLLMIGNGVRWIYSAFIARPIFISAQRPNPQGYLDKLPVLTYRILLTLVGIALTVGVAGIVGLFFHQEHDPTLYTVIAIFAGYACFMVVHIIWRMALAPYLAEYRLPILGDHAAQRLYSWLVAVSALGIFGMTFTLWLQALGLAEEYRVLLIIGHNLLMVVALLALIRVNGQAISGIILAGRDPSRASWVTVIAHKLWPVVTVVYLIFAWGKLSFQMIIGVPIGEEAIIIPYLVMMVGLIAYAGTSYLIERFFTRTRRIREMNREPAALEPGDMPEAARADGADADGDGDEESGGAAPQPERLIPIPRDPGMRTFEDLARRIASLFAIGAAVWALLYYWGGIAVFAESAFFGITEDMIDILFVGYIAYHAVRIWIDQKIEEEGGDEVATGPLDGEGGGTGATRLATLLPLVRNFILTVILIAVALVAATEMGINVAPLFAGAGIVGLAIGFGSQALVRDILSGAFFLIDDAFRKGEYVDIGDVKGTVEKISIRSFQLRHHLGMLHTIPFGEIQYLTNFSRDWVMMKLPLRVTYDTDVEQVRKLIKKLGQQLLEDPVVGDNFIQPLKSQGVIQMDDSAMIIRVKFMTKPGDQWVVRKRVYQEIRDLFDREGIKFAHREVTVRIPDLPKDRELSQPELTAIGGAARRIGDQQAEELMATGTGGPVDDR